METVFGDAALPRARLRRRSRAARPTASSSTPGPQTWLDSTRRARSRRRTATATATGSCSSTRRTPSATSIRRSELETHRESGEYELMVRVRGGHQRYVLDYHPLDVVGWDGYVYPYTFNIHDFEPRAGRIHLPPPVHQTFQGPNFVICSFCPRELDWDPHRGPDPLPPLQPPVRGDHLLRERRVRLAAASTSGRSRCTRAACPTVRSRAWWRSRSARGAPRSWR